VDDWGGARDAEKKDSHLQIKKSKKIGRKDERETLGVEARSTKEIKGGSDL